MKAPRKPPPAWRGRAAARTAARLAAAPHRPPGRIVTIRPMRRTPPGRSVFCQIRDACPAGFAPPVRGLGRHDRGRAVTPATGSGGPDRGRRHHRRAAAPQAEHRTPAASLPSRGKQVLCRHRGLRRDGGCGFGRTWAQGVAPACAGIHAPSARGSLRSGHRGWAPPCAGPKALLRDTACRLISHCAAGHRVRRRDCPRLATQPRDLCQAGVQGPRAGVGWGKDLRACAARDRRGPAAPIPTPWRAPSVDFCRANAQERIDDGSARRAIILRQPCRARCDGRTVPDPVEWAAKAIAARMPPMPDRAASALQRRARKARIAAVDQPPRLRLKPPVHGVGSCAHLTLPRGRGPCPKIRSQASSRW